VTYYLQEKPQGEVTLSFLDAQGELIKAYSSQASETAAADRPAELRVPAEAGMNRFVWPMRYPEARLLPGDKLLADKVVGPLAPPGTYQVRLEVNGNAQTQTFALVKDPRVTVSQADFDAQFALLLQIRDKLSATHDAVNRLRRIRQQVDEWMQRARSHAAADAVSQAVAAVQEKLTAIEDTLIQVHYKGARDRLNLPAKLNAKLAELPSVVAAADFAPPKQAYEVFHDLTARLDQQLQRLQEVIEKDVTEFAHLLDKLKIPAIAS
jgi:DNA-binding FrmR family transcriptional regulator